jgi:hypothetical protein
MSWDVAIVRIRGKFRPIEEVEEEDYRPLGKLKDVRAAVRAAFPSAEWSNPKWAVYESPDFEIEIDLEGVESGNTIILHVHGKGDPIPSILKLTEANGWLAIDCSSGEFLDPKNPSYESWQGFKRLVWKSFGRVVKRMQPLGTSDTVVAPENAARFAASTVKNVEKLNNLELDYSVDSLKHIDEILEGFRAERVTVEDIELTIFCFGCYVGEVIVRNNRGARWTGLAENESESESDLDTGMVVRLASGSILNPIGQTVKRLLNSESDSLPHFYKSVIKGDLGST